MATNPYTGQQCGSVTSDMPNGTTATVNYGSCWDDGGSSISNCVIGCNSGYPVGSGPITGGGAGCISDPSNCVAIYPGAPQQHQGCDQSPKNIGDNLDWDGTQISVADMHSFHVFDDATGHDDIIGWMYLGKIYSSTGTQYVYYYQQNVTGYESGSWSVSVGTEYSNASVEMQLPSTTDQNPKWLRTTNQVHNEPAGPKGADEFQCWKLQSSSAWGNMG